MRFRLAAHAAMAVVVAACSDTDADAVSEMGFTVTDSAGVELAVTTPSVPPPAIGWTISPEPGVVFGESGPDRVEFFRIDDAARLADGRVVALDAGTKQLLYFSPTGELLTSAGREGDGPGEFQRPSGLARLADDTILVYAQRDHRISLFDDEGIWLEDRRLETSEGMEPWRSYRVADAADRAVTLITSSFMIMTFEGEAARDQTLDYPQLRFATDGTFIGEVAEPNTLRLYASGTELDSRLFGGSRMATAGGGRVYVRDAGAYEVRVYGPDGVLKRKHRLVRARRPVTDDDVERFRANRRSTIDDSEARARVLARIDRQPRADSFPSIQGLHIDRLGDIWVTEYSLPWEERGTTAVFAADGPWLGTVEMPPEFRPLEIGENYLLGVVTDELEVQHLVLYQLERDAG